MYHTVVHFNQDRAYLIGKVFSQRGRYLLNYIDSPISIQNRKTSIVFSMNMTDTVNEVFEQHGLKRIKL